MELHDKPLPDHSDGPGLQRILDALQDFISAPTWSDSRRVLEQHPELLDDQADGLLEALARGQEKPEARQPVEEHRALLRRCREVGIEAAFAGVGTPTGEGKAGPTVPSAFQADLRQAIEAEERYERTSDARALDDSAAAWERIVHHPDLAVSDPSFRLAVLNDAGGTYRRRYRATGHVVDLDRALELCQQAVELTPPGSPDLPTLLNNLAIGLSERYARTGELPDLEKAIHHHEQAVQLTPPGSRDLPTLLNNLGNSLRDRYSRTGELPDLEKAIHHYEQAVQLTPPGSRDLPGFLSNLGNGLTNRYARTGELPDLENAIHHYEQAVELTPPGSPELPARLNNLANGLSNRYARTGEVPDLEKAIRHHEQAAQLTPPGSPELPARLNNLAIGLSERYARTGELPDLEKAIRHHEQAVQLTPPGSPDLPTLLNNLGNSLRDRYSRTGELPDLDRAVRAQERAWSVLQTTFAAAPVAYKLGQQRQWASLYARLVTSHLTRAQVSPSQKRAACRRAMEVAEGTKSRLLTELVGRGHTPAPAAIPQEKVTRESELLATLTAIDTAGLATHGLLGSAEKESGRLQAFQDREHSLRELKSLWQEIVRYGREAEDYVALRRGDPPAWEELSSLAAGLGPETALLSLFTTGERTLLFVVREGWEEPAAVEAEVDGDMWEDIARRFQREIHGYDGTGRRGETWDGFLRPLMERASSHLGGVKRIVFAPEAFGHLLPWSVVAWRAGLRGPEELPVPLVTLPALGMLPRLLRRSAGGGRGALVVGNPRGDLPYAEQEAREVREMLGAALLTGQQATRKAVLRDLPGASVVHLATHAYFAPGSPLDSGIVLADGVLTAREVMNHRLQADLMVLSACETGMAGRLGGDELAGLAQAFLQAGARSLVVSLWSVNDPATAALMSGFYAARHAGVDKAVALSRTMSEVRAHEKWLHPYYWGAFVLIGDWA